MNNLIQFLKKEKIISTISILAIFVSFTLLSFIFSFSVLSNTAMNFLQKQVQVRVFFKDTFSEESILSLKSELEKDSRIMEVGYTSKEDALRIFKDLSKNDPILQESLTSNILPASIEIRDYDVKDLEDIANDFTGREYVDSVKYLKDIKDTFKYYSSIITIVSVILFLLFFIVSFGIILSTIRINIFQKKDEIETMKIVGASDEFIQRPFIHQGVTYAMVGSFLAGLVAFITLILMYVSNSLGLKDIRDVYILGNIKVHFIVFSIILVLVINLLGFLLGRFGSKAAVDTYLKI
jgi:cell division transport system permease protein